MSVFEEEWEDYELDKYQFEQWLDSIEGEGTDKEMGEEMDRQADEMKQVEYPEWVINTPKYTMTVSNN